MFKIENILLLVLIIVCSFVALTVVGAVLGDDFVTVIFQAANNTALENQDPPPTEEPEIKRDENSWQVFRSDGYAFEIYYPALVTSKDIPNQSSLSAGIEVPENTPVWEFTLQDPNLFNETNLIDASLVIHISRGESSLAACSEYKPGSHFKHLGDPLPVVEINGTKYWKDIINEGVMGGTYQRISYRAVSQDSCYELTQLIHSKNLETFSPGAVQAFDDKEAFQQLDQVLETFKILDLAATFPPQSYPEPKFVEGAVDKDATEHVDGLDVSHWQGDINWTKVALNDYIFTFAKGTEGVGWTDVNFFTNITEGTEAGVVMGVYHFARPDLGNTGQEEAEYFLSVVGDYLESGYLRPVLDLEVGSYLGKAALSAWVLDWLQTVENQSGVAPLIYTNYNYISYFLTDPVADYDLWIAYWNCNPTPTYDIPPTGMWSDWGFWQYCVKSAGFVPGIHTPIDVNIFNGVEEGLSEFDAASPLWVSLTNYTTAASAPHYADITADVNGDAVGTINYAFWWDCASLEVDITAVSASCGALPAPVEGECLENEFGVRCNVVAEEVKMVEHTYHEVGDYTAKVVVEREAAPPAEDRYHITVYNPILSITPDPISPAVGIINQPFELTVSVDMNTSVSGALQVDLVEDGTGTIEGTGCQTVPFDSFVTRNFDFSWTESDINIRDYTLWARYRAGASCPISDVSTDDLSLAYEIRWTFDAIGLYKSDQRTWFLKEDNTDGWDNIQVFLFGATNPDWVSVVGDWDGNELVTAGMYSPDQQTWYLKDANTSGWENIHTIRFGVNDPSWVPVVGDWHGYGVDVIGLYNPGERAWYLKEANTDGWENIQTIQFGAADPSWVPVVGDWNGDGQDTIGMYSPDQQTWYLKDANTDGWENFQTVQFGAIDPSWVPVVGDWDGDGQDTIGMYSPSQRTWYLKDANTDGWENIQAVKFGAADPSWVPVIGNWD